MPSDLYNADYLHNMEAMYAETTKHIMGRRWGWIKFFAPAARTVLDYGCGCDQLRQFAPSNIIVDSYDIGTVDGAPYPQTGIRHDHYDLICLFDVIEHVDWHNSPDRHLLYWVERSNMVALTVPLFNPYVPGFYGAHHGKSMVNWPHWKPGEHLTYFTHQGVLDLFSDFNLIACGTPECPPRRDIWTFIMRRKNEDPTTPSA